jgi:homoserine O-acetyltransferase
LEIFRDDGTWNQIIVRPIRHQIIFLISCLNLIKTNLFENVLLLATSPKESAWGIAIHEAQRLALVADHTFSDYNENAGKNGLKAARGIGMLTYRNYELFRITQEDNEEKLKNYKASSYINYQGDKLVSRFNAYSYWLLTKSMDSHHIARKRGGDLIKTLGTIQTPTFIMGINSDILCPLDEQRFMEQHMPNATLEAIDSVYGHDGFII